MNKEQTLKFLEFSQSFLIGLIPAYIIVSIIIALELIIHELGHIIFGKLSYLVYGYSGSFTISNWFSHPLLPFIHLPQQTTTSGPVTGLFVFGGIFMMIFLWLFISNNLFKKTKDYSYYLLFVGFLLFELSGNFVCGTDNLTGLPLGLCNPFVKNLPAIISYLMIPFFAWKIQPLTLKLVKKITSTFQ